MKKHVVVVGLMLIVLAVGLSGCTQKDPLSGLGYINTQHGYALNPPRNWTVDETNQSFVLITPPSGEISYFSITVLDVQGKTLGPFVDSWIENLSNVSLSNPSLNFSLLSRNESIIGGMNAIEFVYTLTATSISIPIVYKVRNVLFEKGEKTFWIAYSALQELYDEHLSEFEQSLNSFIVR